MEQPTTSGYRPLETSPRPRSATTILPFVSFDHRLLSLLPWEPRHAADRPSTGRVVVGAAARIKATYP